MLGLAANHEAAEAPDETYKAREFEKTAPPGKLHDALLKLYKGSAEGADKGSLSKFWEPIPISKYLAPVIFISRHGPWKSMRRASNASSAMRGRRGLGS
jgi:hypothetical protein